MATTLTLRRRIKTAQNISKTTRAMQMIAASKLKRAQEAALMARPYVDKLMTLTHSLTVDDQDALHPYMKLRNDTKKTLYIVISPDKGLSGGLVTNLIREYLKHNHSDAYFITIGKKIEGPVAATNKQLLASFPFGNTLPAFEAVLPVIEIVDDYFLNEKIDTVKIITTHFNSVFSQSPAVIDLLPVQLAVQQEDKHISDVLIFEPKPTKLLPPLLKRYLEMVIYQQFLESYVSEQASRMLAMQNATNNAKDIVNQLRLLYNKIRQEKITNEILDISSAAVAMERE
ncbi:MAG TPA: ATP synthase F1 subunit gamma [Candidatus Saccharimonadales bacterium]|nr:ATP synthase F1 subunit gamma [Candidatus Saccharimonadales bacterium]